ncbi:hypothetical protein SAMD00023353_3100340 [Rosellinia necatrix]|uniref:PD-(D/E)XK nuclease-like domain-containing protein n=1 Tax=Rosellinia necatrix TaxID=77044 RepID=A0A1W2TTW6_ROSNE|nr:hypothetical protein SAMD00023353_3100340 [Rosellinia necatrix]
MNVPGDPARSTRSTSPAKLAQGLRQLQKPVKFTHQRIGDLAVTIASVSQGSFDLLKRSNRSRLSRGFLPLEIREFLRPALGMDGDDDEEIDHMFTSRTLPTKSVPADRIARDDGRKVLDQQRRLLLTRICNHVECQEEEETETGAGKDRILHALNLLDELETLEKIVARTVEFQGEPRSEAAWNEHIHGRILELGLADHAEVRVENVTGAAIAEPFQPVARPELGRELPLLASKPIDYTLLLTPDPADPLSGLIRDFVGGLRPRTFNHSTYAPLRTRPGGVFVATKADGAGYLEARAQLGIWLAAWFSRVEDFSSTSNLALPVIIAVGASWQLWFALDRRDCFEVCGPVSIGGTGDLGSIYLLRDCLSYVGDWMATDFRRWVELCVRAG